MPENPPEGSGLEVIAPEDQLWRRLHKDHIVQDLGSGAERISSAAFTDPELSVDVARLVDGDFRVTQAGSVGVAEFAASVALRRGLQVRHEPEPTNYAHAIVRGKKTQSIQKHLARSSTLLR